MDTLSPLSPATQGVSPMVAPGPSYSSGPRPGPATQDSKAATSPYVKVGRTPPPPFFDKSTGTLADFRGDSPHTGLNNRPAPPGPPSCPAPCTGPPSWYWKSKKSVKVASPQPVEGTCPRGGRRELIPCQRGGHHDASAPSSREYGAFPRGGHRQGYAPSSLASGKQTSREYRKLQTGKGTKKRVT